MTSHTIHSVRKCGTCQTGELSLVSGEAHVYECSSCMARTSFRSPLKSAISALLGVAGSYLAMLFLWQGYGAYISDLDQLWMLVKSEVPLVTAGVFILFSSLFMLRNAFEDFLVQFQNAPVADENGEQTTTGWQPVVFPFLIAGVGIVAFVGVAGFIHSLGLQGEKLNAIVSASLVALLMRFGKKHGAKRPLPLSFIAAWVAFCSVTIS